MPSLYLKLALLGGLLAALAASGWYLHHHWWQEGYAQRSAQDAKALAQAEQKAQAITTKVVTLYVTREKVIHDRGATIIKRVPVYVTKADNARCTVNVGFVRLWNDANRLHIPLTASAADEAPSPVVLTDIAAEHAREAQLYHATAEQLTELQSWTRQIAGPGAGK